MLRLPALLLLLALLASCQNLKPPEEKPIAPPKFTPFQVTTGPSSAFTAVLKRVQRRLQQGVSPESANEVVLLESGRDALSARLHLIATAQKSIDYQTFIWADDETGHILARALITAAKRGVKVRVLVDYIGIAKDAKSLAVVTRAHPNLEVRVYRPTARTLEGGMFESIAYGLTNFKGANQRMHHKVLVVDNNIGITGGRNVENSYFDHALSMNFKDRDALIVGPVAQSMTEVFSSFWQYRHTVPAIELHDVAQAKGEFDSKILASPLGMKLIALERQSKIPSTIRRSIVGNLRPIKHAEFISDLPGKNGALALSGGGRATAHILRALEEAQQEVWIQSPYLVLGKKGLRYFRRFRKHHPNVTINISTNSFGSTDNLVAYAGNVRLRDRYVHEFGFNVSEYKPWPRDLRRVLPTYDWLASESKAIKARPSFVCIHAKSFVVDDSLAFVGTFNLDPRSANLNTECGLIMRDTNLANSLREEFERDLHPSNSWIIAERALLQELNGVQMLSREVTDLSPVDLTLLDATSAYELRSGFSAVPRDHPEFHHRFRDVGVFPGSKGPLTDRELRMRLLKFSTPIFDPLL